jgi:hypothetical protein
VQIHIQQRATTGDVVFATLPVGGTTPISRTAGLEVADLDQDGFDDIVILVKDTGLIAQCDQSREDCDVTGENGGYLPDALSGVIVVFFNPHDVYTSPWLGVPLPQSLLAGTAEGDLPEEGGYSSLAVGEIDGVNGPDIVVTLNSAEGDPLTSEIPPNTVNFYPNPGGATARNGEGWSRLLIHGDLPLVSDCVVTDVDGDGDNDIIVTYPTAKNTNVRWLPNPLSLGAEGNVYEYWPQFAPIGHVATEANVIELGDIDGDGNEDVMVRSSTGKVIQWFKKPDSPSQTFIRNPWQVYTIAEFAEREPGAIALGDLTGDGRLDAAIAAEGALAWFTSYASDSKSVFNLWREQVIIDDSPNSTGSSTTSGGGTGAATQQTDPNATQQVQTDPNASAAATGGTLINTLIIVDVDGDGYNDIVATLDRNTLSGLSNDALVLFLNNGTAGE